MPVTVDIKKIISGIDAELADIIRDDLPLLSEIKQYVIKSGGKRVRPLLVYFLCDLFENRHNDVKALGAIVEIIHASSLLHDDVLDEADRRRGGASGRALFGNKSVILGGDYLLACGIDRLNRFENHRLMAIFTKVIKDLSVAELLQMQYEADPSITFDIYERIIYGKTASLFEAASLSAAIYSKQPVEHQNLAAGLGRNLGLLFQLRDDYLDYYNPALIKKPAFTDFQNGLFTYPVLIARKNMKAADISTVNSILSDTPEKRREKTQQKKFMQLLAAYNAREETLDLIHEKAGQIKEILSELPAGESKDRISEQLNRLMKL